MSDDQRFHQAAGLIEPHASPLHDLASLASMAISLRRIADALDRVTTTSGIEKLVTDFRPVFEAMDK